MPVYVEMVKDKKTGKMKEKKVDGKKQYYLRTYITDEFGNKKQITRHNKDWLGNKGEREAKQEEIRLQNKVFNSYENNTLDELSKDFFNYKIKTVKYSTYIKHLENYDNYIKEFFVNRKYYELTTLDIKKWKDMMDNRNLSLNTKKSAFITLSAILEYGCQYFGLQKNVARIIKNFKGVKGQKKKRMKFITNEQFEKAILYEKKYIYYVAFNLLFYCGLRRGELLSINKFDDIDFDNNILIIDETINPKISDKPTPPKTDKSNRKIEILPFLMDMLREIVKNDNSTDGYIFLHNIKLTTLKYKCDAMFSKIGFEKDDLIRIHDLRHSFASYCIEKGVEIQILSEYMGHENISITWDTYGHLYPNSHKKLLEKIKKQDQKQDQSK